VAKADRDLPLEDAAARLLDRSHPPGYLEAWRRSLRRVVVLGSLKEQVSAGVFRVGEELLAIDTAHVVEVCDLPVIRTLPGRSNDVFRGLVSIRGEIHLCASTHALLGIPPSPAGPPPEPRLLVVEREGARWALVVDEVLDFRRFDADAIQPAQVTVSKAAVHFSDAVLRTPAGPAARLDARRLFEGLDRSLA
jgi:chemotaxis-related protein WspD